MSDRSRGSFEFPNFLVVGAQRCGTSALCQNLGKHPDIAFCRPLECHFYSDEVAFSKGLDWYRSLFSHVHNESAVGDGSVTYCSPERLERVLPRLQKFASNCKIIHCARHPLRRLESAWKHSQYRGAERRSFEQAMAESAYLQNSLFWKQLQGLRQVYQDGQILTVQLENYSRDPQAQCQRVFRFLGVDSDFQPSAAGDIPNPSAQFTRTHPMMRRLKKSVVANIARRFIPQTVRRRIATLGDESVDTQVRWTQDMLANIRALVENDSRSYLEYAGLPADFWNLS